MSNYKILSQREAHEKVVRMLIFVLREKHYFQLLISVVERICKISNWFTHLRAPLCYTQMSTRVTGGARRERHVTKSEEKERLLAVHAIAKNFVQYKHRLECSVSWYVMHMKYCKYEHRTCYYIQKKVKGQGQGQLLNQLVCLQLFYQLP